MKNHIIIILATILLVGCEISNPDGSYNTSSSGTIFLETIVIDSCEYVDGYYRLAHKGNCKYCAKRRKTELEEFIKNINGEEKCRKERKAEMEHIVDSMLKKRMEVEK